MQTSEKNDGGERGGLQACPHHFGWRSDGGVRGWVTDRSSRHSSRLDGQRSREHPGAPVLFARSLLVAPSRCQMGGNLSPPSPEVWQGKGERNRERARARRGGRIHKRCDVTDWKSKSTVRRNYSYRGRSMGRFPLPLPLLTRNESSSSAPRPRTATTSRARGEGPAERGRRGPSARPAGGC